MQDVKEIKDRIKQSTRFEVYPKTIPGGQSVGLASRGVTLINDDVDFSISIAIGRSNLKNRELAATLFELYLDEVIK